jgi:dihydroneopterin aldolase
MDKISIRGLRAEALIGVHAWERKLPRVLLIDLELATDACRAAKSDSIKDALDYQAVSDATVRFAEASRFQLIETLAEKLAEQLLKEFSVEWLRIAVHKPGAVAAAQSVSVTIERGTKS